MAETDFQQRATRSPRFSTNRAPGFLGGGLSTTGTRPIEEDENTVVPSPAPPPTKGEGGFANTGNDGPAGNEGSTPGEGDIASLDGYVGPIASAIGIATGIPGLGLMGDLAQTAIDIDQAKEFSPEDRENVNEFSAFLHNASPFGLFGEEAIDQAIGSYQSRTGTRLNNASLAASTNVRAGKATYSGPKGVVGPAGATTGGFGATGTAGATSGPTGVGNRGFEGGTPGGFGGTGTGNTSGPTDAGGRGFEGGVPGGGSSTTSGGETGPTSGPTGIGPRGFEGGTPGGGHSGHVNGLGQTGNAGNASAGNPDGSKGPEGNAPGSRGENDAEHGGGNAGGSSDTRVICSQLHRAGLMSKADYLRDLRFTRDHLTDLHVKGYHVWALPTVRAMRRSRVATAIWRYIGQSRANQIAYVCGERDRPDWAGRIIRAVGEPLCYYLGILVEKTGREVDYRTLYTEKKNAD